MIYQRHRPVARPSTVLCSDGTQQKFVQDFLLVQDYFFPPSDAEDLVDVSCSHQDVFTSSHIIFTSSHIFTSTSILEDSENTQLDPAY